MSNRRSFLKSMLTMGSISVMEWLGLFRIAGVPGTPKDWGIAKASASEITDDRFLIYWFAEGGWDSFSMFSPIHTPNHSALQIPVNTLDPVVPWSSQFYRAKNYGIDPNIPIPSVFQNIEHGYLAAPGRALFSDMCVVSSHLGNLFHSGGRWDYHYGSYNRSLNAYRLPTERTILQAFCEEKGSSFLLPHISWHRWLADGELDLGQYPEGTGYYEKLGPAYAHTIYGRTPADLKARLSSLGDVSSQARRQVIRKYTDQLRQELISQRDGASIKAFASALEIHQQLSTRSGQFNLQNLFNDEALKLHFGIRQGDEQTTATIVNGMPARSKDSPHIRMQSMMAYELMKSKISCGLWLENREVRGFDSHSSRRNVLDRDGNSDQRQTVIDEIWDPLTKFVQKLKETEMPGQAGVSMFDKTTIVLASEMGRTIRGDVDAVLRQANLSADQKYQQILDQDVCQHWSVNSVAFLGGNVRGGSQFGKVGSMSLEAIPIMPDGSLDPAYDAVTGLLINGRTKSNQSFLSDPGYVYSTALALSGVNPVGKGLNTRSAMGFVAKPV
jgi:hypothetical protein